MIGRCRVANIALMNINEMTIGQAKDLASLFGAPTPSAGNTFFEVGKDYLIRTVTMHNIGRVKAINANEVLLESASWIADSGRFNKALKTGELSEVEPFEDDVIVNRGSIIDATSWKHGLPKAVK